MISRIYIFLIAFLIILFDQLTKYAVSTHIMFGEKYPVLNNVISLFKTYNTGAAFSILKNNTNLLILFSFIVVFLITAYFIKNSKSVSYLCAIGWGFILGGTIGNLIDRVNLGYVIDFIQLDFINFPIFNFADLFINIGAIFVLIYVFFNQNRIYAK